jgi:hypothetical protein
MIFNANKNANETTDASDVNTKLQNSESGLILFDKKTKWVLFAIFCFYMLASISKIHTSSVDYWDIMFGINEPKSLIFGRPQPIRQDEWMLSTPASLDLTKRSSKTTNSQRTTLEDFKVIFHPKDWASLFLSKNDFERKFAFNWNFVIYGYLAACFLFCLLLTRNNFYVSVFGALFIYYSSAIHWWSYQIADWLIWVSALFISAAYLFIDRRPKVLVFSGFIFLIAAYNFVTRLYPAWQVPLVYFLLFSFTGYFLTGKKYLSIQYKSPSRWIIFSVLAIAFALLIYNYYDGLKDYISLMMNTVYPGRRTSNGGDLIQGKLFSEFYGIFMDNEYYPEVWLNICEISGFLMFFPVIFYEMGKEYYRTKKFDWLSVLVSTYITLLLIWVLVGFPTWLSKYTLMSMSPAYRTLPILGLANIFLLLIFISRRPDSIRDLFSLKGLILNSTSWLVFITSICYYTNVKSGYFFTLGQVVIVISLMTTVYVLIQYSNHKYAMYSLMVLLLGINIHNFSVNPISSGLSAITKNSLVKATAEIKQNDPDARWAVFGSHKVTNLLVPNKINTLNGIKYVPNFDDMKVLDPQGKSKDVYNRYAHISLYYHKDIGDFVIFQLHENKIVNDLYTIIINPCSEKLKQLRVKYTVFTYSPVAEEIQCMTLVKDMGGLFIYVRNDL